MNATKEKYEDEEVKESYIKWTLNQVTMLQQLQCRRLQADFKLATSIKALKGEVDATLKMFKIYDSSAVDFSDHEDEKYLVKLIGSCLVKQQIV